MNRSDVINDRMAALLRRWNQGDSEATRHLVSLVYDQLHLMAERAFRSERANHTLQPTALLHELFLKLVECPRTPIRNKSHFFAIAALSMRQILVSHARKKNSLKRSAIEITFHEPDHQAPVHSKPIDLIMLDDALRELEQLDPKAVEYVELRYFGGLSVGEVAALFGENERSLFRRWAWAKAWLIDRIGEPAP